VANSRTLPLGVTGFDLEFFRGIGVATIGEALALPRDGLAQRCGEAVLDALDRACGRTPESHAFFDPPARFSARLELPGETAYAEALLFPARRLLAQLAGLLAARHEGLRAYTLRLIHFDSSFAEIEIRLASASRDAVRFARLLQEKLGDKNLQRPVEAIELHAAGFEPLGAKSGGLFGDAAADEEDWARLVERLRMRLGAEAVCGLATQPDHRPEHAWRRVEPGEWDPREFRQPGARPLWLLEESRRLAESEFTLLSGPERIECGWWDGDEAKRDYFIARLAERCPRVDLPRRRRMEPAWTFLPDYAELHCLSSFSFLRGASHPEELVERAHALGYAALALTDECSLAGAVRAHRAAKECGLKLIFGTEVTLEDGLKLVLLATDRRSYGAICALITTGRRRGKKGSYALQRKDVEGINALLLLPSGKEEDARWAAAHFPGRAWIAAELHCGPNDRAKLESLKRLGLPLVAAGDVHMHLRSRKPLQDVLTAIRLGKPVAECGQALQPNAERHLRLRMRLAQLYPPELLAEAARIAARCDFSLDELRYEYPEELVPQGETPATWLRKLALEGLQWRFRDGVPQKVRELAERELTLIAELRYEPFFLTVHDVVRYARGQGILCQGRGSAANSVICYALGITEVDPARMSMLFERFVSKERNEPPDIDVDFEHQRREEVIQYVYRKYGRERAALAATVICYRTKSALRDAGKALGVPAEEVDRIAKSFAFHDEKINCLNQWMEIAALLKGFPRHLSQHVGGFVISRGPLAELVPVENAAMPDRTVIQWDKDDLEALGLLKVDVLALGMLSAIQRCLKMIGKEMHEIPPEDPAVYGMIQRADTIGVFQIESRAQMSMLPRLRPKTYYDLVIEVAIVRPGPIQGGMVHPYLRRRQGLEPVTYQSEAVREVLERTLGVPIFQEQVMQLAMVAAGFTPGEADRLRRSMAAWKKRGGLEPFEERLKSGMARNGYSAEFADAIYRQILGFGEYGFPESHSASFALLVYVSSWLKHHHPAAFCAALLNSQPMGFYAPAQLVQDARRHGVEVLPADVNASDWDCTLENGALRLGLRMVSGLSEAAGERIASSKPYRCRFGAGVESQGAALPGRGGCIALDRGTPPPRVLGGGRRRPASAARCRARGIARAGAARAARRRGHRR
jgi:error-prone DNA polymerase